MINVDINSPSFVIRYGILERLKLIPTFKSVKRWSLTPAFRVQAKIEDSQIPYVGCYHIEELMGPDGDANHAEPRFTHTLKIGFSIWIAAIDENVADQNLDSSFWTIMNLLTNPKWSVFPAAGNWNLGRPIRIESVTRGLHRKRFGNRMINNETPIAEMDLELTVVHRSDFPPWPLDDLNRVHVTVAYPWPYDPNLYEPFTVEYDLPIDGQFTVHDYSLLGLSFAKPFLGMPVSPYALASPSFAKPILTVT